MTLIRAGQRLHCSSGKGRVLAEPWGSSNSALRDGLSSLLGDKSGWHGPGEGTYLSVQRPLCCPHVPKPSGHPKFEPKSPLPYPSPPPPQPARLYDATAGASLGRIFRNYIYICTRRGRAAPGAYITVLDATGGAAGPGSRRQPRGRAGTRHTQPQGTGSGDKAR